MRVCRWAAARPRPPAWPVLTLDPGWPSAARDSPRRSRSVRAALFSMIRGRSTGCGASPAGRSALGEWSPQHATTPLTTGAAWLVPTPAVFPRARRHHASSPGGDVHPRAPAERGRLASSSTDRTVTSVVPGGTYRHGGPGPRSSIARSGLGRAARRRYSRADQYDVLDVDGVGQRAPSAASLVGPPRTLTADVDDGRAEVGRRPELPGPSLSTSPKPVLADRRPAANLVDCRIANSVASGDVGDDPGHPRCRGRRSPGCRRRWTRSRHPFEVRQSWMMVDAGVDDRPAAHRHASVPRAAYVDAARHADDRFDARRPLRGRHRGAPGHRGRQSVVDHRWRQRSPAMDIPSATAPRRRPRGRLAANRSSRRPQRVEDTERPAGQR